MSNKKWSSEVTKKSDSLDLEEGVFTWDDPERIAKSLKRSAEESNRRKTDPYRSAMSMINFYINRAGGELSQKRKNTLENSKKELKKLYNKN